MADDNLNIQMSASGGDDAAGQVDIVIQKYVALQQSMNDAAAKSGAASDTVRDGAEGMAQAVGSVATAQDAASASMVGSLKSVSVAQEQILAELQGRFAQELASHTAMTDAEIAQRLKWLDNERQMGRMSLEDEQARVSELLAITEQQSTARIAAERAVQMVNAEIVAQSIADYRAEAAAGVLSAGEQIKALQSIADEAEYSLKVRSLASDEITRIEKANAVASAEAITAAEREKRAAAVATAAEMKEASYVAMDVGYGLSSLGVKGGKTLADLAYLARDFTAAGAGMVVQMGFIGIAVAAVTESVGLLARGFKEAESEQSQMATIRAAVESEGASWDAARQSIEDYTTALEANSTYSKGEALDSINQLIQRSLTYQQAEEAETAAANLAAAEHIKLSEAVKLLTSAEGSRAAALERYDPSLKTLIDRHASLHDIVLQVARDFDGEYDDALNTTEGTSEHLKNQTDELGKHLSELGSGPLSDLIGFLDTTVQKLNEAFDAMQRFLSEASATQSSVDANGNVYVGVGGNPNGTGGPSDGGGFGTDAGDDMFAKYGHTKKSPYNDPTGRGQGASDNKDIRERIDAVSEMFRTGRMGYAEALRQEDELKSKYKLTSDQVNELSLAEMRLADERDAKAKSAERSGESAEKRAEAAARRAERQATKAPEEYGTKIGDDSKTTDGLADQQKDLDATLKALTGSEDEYREAVKTASTAQDEQTAKTALANKVHVDAIVSVDQINIALAAEKKALEGATAEQTRHQEAADALKAAYNALLATVQSHHRATTQQQEDLKNLKFAYDLHSKAATDAGTAVSTLTGDFNTNTTALDANLAKLDQDREASAHLSIELAAMAQHYFDTENARAVANVLAAGERQQAYDDEIATYGKSLSAQATYYAQRYANAVAAGGEYSEAAQALAEKIRTIDLDEYKQRFDAQKQFLDQLQEGESTLVDGIVEKHQTLKQTLHDIWTDIVKDFEKQIETMILKGSLLNGLNAEISKMFGGAGGLNAATTGASSGGVFGALFGSSGSSQVATSLPSSGGVMGQLYGPGAVAAPGTSAGASGSGSGGGSSSDSSDIYGVAYGSQDSMGNPVVGTPTGGTGALGAILGGAGYGSLAAGLDGGNATGGLLGGALGGGLGLLLHANPLVGAGIDLATGLIGSLFGDHSSPGKNPDDYESQTGYGQDVSDLQFGQANADGTYYYPSAAVAKFVSQMNVANGSINGGANQGMQSVNSNGTIASSGGIDAAEMWLAQNQGDTAAQLEQMGVSPAQLQKWISLFGASATGSGQYSHIAGDSNIGDIEVTGATTGGGTKTTYSALATALQSIISDASGGTGVVPTFAVTRAYNDPSIVTGAVSTGTYTPTPQNLLGTPAAPTTTAGGNVVGTASAAADAIAFGGPSKVSVTINGNVVGPGGLESISQEIAIALGRLANGTVPGGNNAVTQALARFTGGS